MQWKIGERKKVLPRGEDKREERWGRGWSEETLICPRLLFF